MANCVHIHCVHSSTLLTRNWRDQRETLCAIHAINVSLKVNELKQNNQGETQKVIKVQEYSFKTGTDKSDNSLDECTKHE